MSLKSETPKIPSYRKRLGYHSGLLGGIGLLASVTLAIAHIETEGHIVAAQQADQKAILEQVLPASLHDNDPLADTLTFDQKQVFLARERDKVTGAAFEVAEPGYSGLIRVIMAVDRQGKILGVRTLGHSETPGLGDKIELAKDPWVLDFDGKSLGHPEPEQWGVKKDGGVFDQFTGATITPRAYVKAVKEGLEFFAAHKVAIIEARPPGSTVVLDGPGAEPHNGE